MRVIWTPSSRANLDSIFDYISQDSPQNAQAMIDRITARAWQLEAFPLSGHVVPEYNDRNMREVLVGSYRVIYRVSGDEVQIVSVVHGACLLSTNPRRDE